MSGPGTGAVGPKARRVRLRRGPGVGGRPWRSRLIAGAIVTGLAAFGVQTVPRESPALASETTSWTGNGGDNLPCTGGSTQWNLTGFGDDADDVSNVALFVNGAGPYVMSRQGNIFKALVPGPGTSAEATTAHATWDWNGEGAAPEPLLTISHCVDGGPSPSPSPSPSESPSPSPSEPPSPSTTLSVSIDKTNDADRDGGYTDDEEASGAGADVRFRVVVTNTGEVPVAIVSLRDAFAGEEIDLLASGCTELAGATLAPGASVTCAFTLQGYSPPATRPKGNVASVCVEPVEGTGEACDEDGSTVRSAEVLGTTVTPTPSETRTPPGGTAFTGPGQAVSLAGLALLLLTLGSGLLWVGGRRRRPAERG